MTSSLARLAAAPALLASVVFAPALAQEPTRRVDPASVIAVVTADWNEDGGVDRAVLVADADEPSHVDLHIALSRHGEPFAERLLVPGIAWQSTMWGTLPELELAPNGSLRVISRNDSIGRDRWERVLTLAFRDGRFVVGGLSHTSRDTLDPDAGSQCDVNLFTGHGLLDGTPIRTAMRAVPVDEWTADTTPPECGLER